MKKTLFSLSLLIFSISSITASLPEFKNLSKTIQEDLLSELKAEPVFIKDTSAETEIDGTYLGLVKKNDKTYVFDAFIWYGTQGADGVAISNLGPLEDRYESGEMKTEVFEYKGSHYSGDCSLKLEIGALRLDQVHFTVTVRGGDTYKRIYTDVVDFYKELNEWTPSFVFHTYDRRHTKYASFRFKLGTNPKDLKLDRFTWGRLNRFKTPIDCRLK